MGGLGWEGDWGDWGTGVTGGNHQRFTAARMIRRRHGAGWTSILTQGGHEHLRDRDALLALDLPEVLENCGRRDDECRIGEAFHLGARQGHVALRGDRRGIDRVFQPAGFWLAWKQSTTARTASA